MINNRFSRLFILIPLLAMIVILGPNKALAATSRANGISVSPASKQVFINPDEAVHTLQFRLTNSLPTPVTISLSAKDFNTLDQTGGLFFEGYNSIQTQNKYTLASWINIPNNMVTIPAGQTVIVNADILNQPSLTPGGHYGAIMFNIITGSTAVKNGVGLQPIASSLLFVDKVGGDIHKLTLTGVSAKHSAFSLPGSITLNFRNDGNTHLLPRGLATISDSKGKLYSQGIINQDSQIILPGKNRYYSVKFTKLVTLARPGTYKLTVNYRYDGYDKYKAYRTSLLVILPLSWLLFAAFSGIVFGAFYYFFILHKNAKRYRRTVWIETRLVIRDLKIFIKFIYRKFRELLAKT